MVLKFLREFHFIIESIVTLSYIFFSFFFCTEIIHIYYRCFDFFSVSAEHLYKCQNWVLTVLLTTRLLGKSTVDTYIDWLLGNKLDAVLVEHRLVKLIHLLRGIY